MSIDPLISVVIPAYNAEKFIIRTLDSVREQTFRNYEIIVVDDGSHDSTKNMVDRYIEDNCLSGCCLHQENKGIAAARNFGITNARGSFIALLDHDDVWYPLKLQKVMDEFNLHPSAGLVSHNLLMVRNGKPCGVLKTGPAAEKMYESILFSQRGAPLTPSAAVFKKEGAFSIGGFRENPEFNTAEDFDFWLRLSRVMEFHFIGEILGEYTIIESGASKKSLYHCRSVEAVLNDHFKNYIGCNPSWTSQVKMRKTLAGLYRTTLHNLLKQKAPKDIQKNMLVKMLGNYPFNLKNILIAMLWLVKR